MSTLKLLVSTLDLKLCINYTDINDLSSIIKSNLEVFRKVRIAILAPEYKVMTFFTLLINELHEEGITMAVFSTDSAAIN